MKSVRNCIATCMILPLPHCWFLLSHCLCLLLAFISSLQIMLDVLFALVFDILGLWNSCEDYLLRLYVIRFNSDLWM